LEADNAGRALATEGGGNVTSYKNSASDSSHGNARILKLSLVDNDHDKATSWKGMQIMIRRRRREKMASGFGMMINYRAHPYQIVSPTNVATIIKRPRY